jgi:hypothetical protein
MLVLGVTLRMSTAAQHINEAGASIYLNSSALR